MSELKILIEKIENLTQDSEIPRKVKEVLIKVCNDLKNPNQDNAVKISSAIYELDSLSNDFNIPMHTKTILWDLISELEGIKE